MILSDREIQAALRDRILFIDPPPDERLYTSTALDLTLDSVLLRWHEPGNHPSGQPIKLYPHRPGFNIKALMTNPGYTARVPIDPKVGFELGPKQFVLGYTEQKIYLPNSSRIAARVEGESSLARLGVGVHVTAPTIHAGFGYNPEDADHPGLPIQLEIFNVGNQIVVLDIGMPICQLILEEVREVPARGYQGRFCSRPAELWPLLLNSVLIATVESDKLAFFTRFAEAVPEATIRAQTDESITPHLSVKAALSETAELVDRCDERCQGFVRSWAQRRLPFPLVGYEFRDGNGQVRCAQAELAWPDRKVAAVLPEGADYRSAFEQWGWTVFDATELAKHEAKLQSLVEG